MILAPGLTIALLAGDAGADSSTAERKVLTVDGAKKAASAAAADAKAHQDNGAIAIVDDGGDLLYLERLDGSFPAGSNISIGKVIGVSGAANQQRDEAVAIAGAAALQ